MLAVVCVLKSGGDFGARYVEKLRDTVSKNLSLPHQFLCYTDLPEEISSICEVRPLLKNLPGWWSKVEIFNETGPTIYFDLDTFIFKSIDPLTQVFETPGAFFMLRPFGAGEVWASGIMVWSGDFNFINYEFIWEQSSYLQWDQRYITAKLGERRVRISAVQDLLPGIKSYKYHCRKSLKADTSVVCFHGRSVRPHTIQKGWAKKVWNG